MVSCLIDTELMFHKHRCSAKVKECIENISQRSACFAAAFDALWQGPFATDMVAYKVFSGYEEQLEQEFPELTHEERCLFSALTFRVIMWCFDKPPFQIAGKEPYEIVLNEVMRFPSLLDGYPNPLSFD